MHLSQEDLAHLSSAQRREMFKRAWFAAQGRDLYVDQPLSNVALDFKPDDSIADLIMPVVDVPNQSGFVTEFFRKDTLRQEESRRSPGTEANKIFRNVGSRQFFCQNYALKTGVTDEDLANADALRKAKLFDGAAEYVTGKHWRGWEKRATALATASNVGSSAGVASRWNGAGNPFANINAAFDVVKNLSGVKPNRLLFGEEAWNSFRRDSTIRGLVFGSSLKQGLATVEHVKNLFEIDQVLISRTMENTANIAQAESLSRVFADHVLAYYAPSKPSKDEPSWAYSYRWAVPGIPSMVAERHPHDSKKHEQEVEVGYFQGEYVTGPEYGYLILSVNSNT